MLLKCKYSTKAPTIVEAGSNHRTMGTGECSYCSHPQCCSWMSKKGRSIVEATKD